MTSPQELFLDLTHQVQELVKRILQSEKDNESLKIENQKLILENCQLKKRIIELEENSMTNRLKPIDWLPHKCVRLKAKAI